MATYTLRVVQMFKKLTDMLLGKISSKPTSDGFFLKVRCGECGERFNLFINKSWELMQNFEENGSVTYSLKKEVFGVGCKNRVHVEMNFDSEKNLISKQISNGSYIEDENE
jgi:hypothetical protein